jgi:hypothetical protein
MYLLLCVSSVYRHTVATRPLTNQLYVQLLIFFKYYSSIILYCHGKQWGHMGTPQSCHTHHAVS